MRNKLAKPVDTARAVCSALILAAACGAATAANAATVNVDGVSNASLDGSNSVDITLDTGIYSLAFIEDQYTAFSRFSGESGCTNGQDCTRGWENSVRYTIGTDTFQFGDGSASGGIGPIDPGDGYFESDVASFANSSIYSDTFTINGDGTVVSFFIYDDILTDNRGGVSLAVTQVPLPAAAWLFGSALIGLGWVRRRAVSAA